MTQHIQTQVDQLLLEQGEYLPLEFLLREGRLHYADYEAWRNGEIDYLDSALFGDREHIQQQLMQAAEYLQRRDWQPETILYTPWHNHHSQANSAVTTRPLHFSENRALDHHFHQRYRKSQDQPQLDLFTDAPATILANGICQSLANRNSIESRRQLEILYDIAPDHTRLGELEDLVNAAESLTTAVLDTAAELRYLQETLTPRAENLLGKDSRNLLIPLWRRLSAALQDQPYQPATRELHLSYTASQAADWEIVRQAVERTPHWQNDLVLLQRHAQACDHLQQKVLARQSWFMCCWQFPTQSETIESSSDALLRQSWRKFQELDPELAAIDFPAWLLLSEPAQLTIMPAPSDITCAYPDSYSIAYRLQQQKYPDASLDDRTAMDLRAQLKQQNPILFHYFLEFIGK